jgi:hypothetical protein
MAACASAHAVKVLPTTVAITADCTRFGESAEECDGDFSASRPGRFSARGSRMATHGGQAASQSHLPRREPRTISSPLDRPIWRAWSGGLHFRSRPRARSAPCAGTTSCTRASASTGYQKELGSPASSANYLEVSPLKNHTIAPTHQLRLTLSGTTAGSWPDEIWDSLPDDVRREVLARLAHLLSQWLESKRRRA